MKIQKSKLTLISAIALLVSSLLSIPGSVSGITALFNYLSVFDYPTNIVFVLNIFFDLLLFIGCATIGILALTMKNLSKLTIPVLIFFLLGPVIQLLIPFIWVSIYAGWQDIFSNFWNWFIGYAFGIGYEWTSTLFVAGRNISIIAAILLGYSIISNKIKKQNGVEKMTNQTPKFDPYTGKPLEYEKVSSTSQSTSSSMPVLALVLAFFAPIAGIILGHISLNQMKRGQISSDGEGLAKAGMILGYVFTGLTTIFVLIIFVAAAVSRSSYY